MMDFILGLALALPAQAPAAPAAAPPQADRKAEWQAGIQKIVAKKRMARAQRADNIRRARAAARERHKAELEHQARIAPVVAAQQYRQAQLDLSAASLAARIESDRAYQGLARQWNLIVAYGVGAPVTLGPYGIQVYDGFGYTLPYPVGPR